MTFTIRIASGADVSGVAKLTAANRHRLSRWSPRWWRPSATADQIHPTWLKHLIESDGPVVRVADDDGEIVGCVASTKQPHTWFIDDLAVATEERWSDVGVGLADAVTERPAMTCVAAADRQRIDALHQVGLSHVSDYWIRETAAGEATIHPLKEAIAIPDPPPHTFGGPLDPHADGALAFGTDRGGIVVGSPPSTAPPVYDPGGSVCIIDRVVNPDDALIRAAIAAAGQRGDVLVAVVAASTDEPLRHLLETNGFCRTVDVYRWP